MNISEVNIDALELALEAVFGKERADQFNALYRVVDQAMTHWATSRERRTRSRKRLRS
jgi:hypothetical protein